MLKIQIKSIYDAILFEYEKENNTVKDTVIEAVKSKTYLTGAYLTGADLRDADLRGGDLRGAYLTGADLRGADLRGAYLTGAGGNKIVIKKAAVFTGLYDYVVIPFISQDGVKYVKMGCFIRTVEDWDKDFWNNDNEFPNDNSKKSNLRLFAYNTAKEWFKLIESKN